MVGMTVMGKFTLGGLAGRLEKLLSDWEDRNEWRKAIERYFLREWLRPQTEVILESAF